MAYFIGRLVSDNFGKFLCWDFFTFLQRFIKSQKLNAGYPLNS